MNKYISAGERRVLQRLVEHEEEELTQAIPGGWWIEEDQIDGRIGWSLLRKCLIRCTYDDNKNTYFTYRPNEEGEKVLTDDHYVPLIIRHQRGEDITNG